MHRKRRSNRLTPSQLDAQRTARTCRLHQLTILIGYGQEHVDPALALYRSVSVQVAQRMVREGEAEQLTVLTDNGATVYFRELKPFEHASYCLPTMPNAASSEAMAANTPGARLSGRDRTRVEHILAWPLVGDTRAPRVAPRVSSADRDAGEKMFQRVAGARPSTAGHCYRKAA